MQISTCSHVTKVNYELEMLSKSMEDPPKRSATAPEGVTCILARLADGGEGFFPLSFFSLSSLYWSVLQTAH